MQAAGQAKIKPTLPKLEQAQRMSNSQPLREQIKVSPKFLIFLSCPPPAHLGFVYARRFDGGGG